MSEHLWEDIKAFLKTKISEGDFGVWIADLKDPIIQGNTIVIRCASNFELSHIKSNYDTYIKEALQKSEATGMNVLYVEDTESESTQVEQTVSLSSQAENAAIQSNLKDAIASTEQSQNRTQERLERIQKQANLNGRYTFDSFIAGDNSRFSLNTALAAAKNPGISHNPLMIYGGVGLGKTHIISSIGNYIIKENVHNAGGRELKVLYVTAENFANQFINSIKLGNVSDFSMKYKTIDVLLLDDIQFLQGKEGMQEQLFHIFNELYEKGKQMVFTADRPINELKNITDRLRSRFQRGIIVDITPPQYEIRLAILKEKLAASGQIISDEVLDFIAVHVETNVRDLEGALSTLTAYQAYMHEDVSLEIARERVKNYINVNKETNLDIGTVLRAVADAFKTSITDIKGQSKNKSIAMPRHIAAYLCKEMTKFSMSEIGSELGGRAHSTIINSWKKIDKERTVDRELDAQIEKIKRDLKFSR